ncbi:hypothetical protein KY363_07310 [Candidatus Woesearchaeota archaeon]|nr:hypothetical protein [Candidatus Woesearchaeota archaeon]
MDIKDIKTAFSKDSRLKSAFRAVKIDLDLMNEHQSALKNSTHEWTVFLYHENQGLKKRLADLERKTQQLERAVDSEKTAILRQI